jgi:hypothetical protein
MLQSKLLPGSLKHPRMVNMVNTTTTTAVAVAATTTTTTNNNNNINNNNNNNNIMQLSIIMVAGSESINTLVHCLV